MTTINTLPPFTPLGNGGATTPPLPGDGNCRSCGRGLIRMQGFPYHWPLACDNWHCQLYRERQGAIQKETDGEDVPWYLKYSEACSSQAEREHENYKALVAVGVAPDRATMMKSNTQTSAYLKHHYLRNKRE